MITYPSINEITIRAVKKRLSGGVNIFKEQAEALGKKKKKKSR